MLLVVLSQQQLWLLFFCLCSWSWCRLLLNFSFHNFWWRDPTSGLGSCPYTTFICVVWVGLTSVALASDWFKTAICPNSPPWGGNVTQAVSVRHWKNICRHFLRERNFLCPLGGVRRDYEVLNSSCLFVDKMAIPGAAGVLARWSGKASTSESISEREWNQVLVIMSWLPGQSSQEWLISRYFSYISS